MVKLLVEEGGLVEPGIPWRRHCGRSRSWGSGGGWLGSTQRRASRVLPWGRWGFGSDGPNEYDEVRNMGTWGVLGASGRCVSVSIAIGALDVAIGLDDFFDFAALREEEDAIR